MTKVLDTDVFFVTQDERTVIFAPLRGIILELPKDMSIRDFQAGSEGAMAVLQKAGLVVESSNRTLPPKWEVTPDFFPTGVVFMVTSACNLRCRYCYAEGGTHHAKPFDFEMGLHAAHFVVDNAARVGEREAFLNFHGGGEPTLDMPFIRSCVEGARSYARQRYGDGIKVIASMVTNGACSNSDIEWIADNVDSIQISYDGPEFVHDVQRPGAHGEGTESRVRETILKLEHRVPDVLIKSTISAFAVDYMPQIAEHLCTSFDAISRFHFGPVLGAGRGRSRAFGEPSPEKFVAGCYAAREVARHYGKQIVVSGAENTFPRVRATFCGVTDPNFALTANGEISACYEILYASDPRARDYFYGTYDCASGSFVVDTDKLVELRSRSVAKLERCRSCFAKWQCAGDCQIRWRDSVTGLVAEGRDIRCAINRELIRRKIFGIVDSHEAQ